jgi:hypothetical protein
LDKNGKILVAATNNRKPRGIVKYIALGNILSRSKMIRRLVLDVLKPHNPSVVELSEALSHLEGVEGVNIIIYEIDQKVENAKVIIAGSSIDFESIKKELEEMGATIHSVDEVAAGKRIVEEVKTPQDRSARM